MSECVQGAHLRATGKALVEDPERTKDPVDFVQRLLAEKDKYDRSAALRGHFAGHACLAVQASWAFSVFLCAATTLNLWFLPPQRSQENSTCCQTFLAVASGGQS